MNGSLLCPMLPLPHAPPELPLALLLAPCIIILLEVCCALMLFSILYHILLPLYRVLDIIYQ